MDKSPNNFCPICLSEMGESVSVNFVRNLQSYTLVLFFRPDNWECDKKYPSHSAVAPLNFPSLSLSRSLSLMPPRPYDEWTLAEAEEVGGEGEGETWKLETSDREKKTLVFPPSLFWVSFSTMISSAK